MKKNIILPEEDTKRLLAEFYQYLTTGNKTKDGHKFEIFLRAYLTKLGFEDVEVTHPITCHADGGIDLTARKLSISEVNDSYYETYIIQAKLKDPETNANVRDIRALGGTSELNPGIFITTARVTQAAKEEAMYEKIGEALIPKRKPVFVIDGTTLINSCIDMELDCFVFKPVFSPSSLEEIVTREFDDIKSKIPNTNEPLSPEIIDESRIYQSQMLGLSRKITPNDVRARILPIPKVILSNIPESVSDIEIAYNNDTEYTSAKIDASRRYISSKVKELYRSSNVVDAEGVFTEKTAYWIDEGENKYRIRIY